MQSWRELTICQRSEISAGLGLVPPFEMSGKQIWYFIKFFTEVEHAEMFMDGNVYMNRLSFFKALEASSDDWRSDRNEAISHWWQPDDAIIKLNFPGFPELIINKDDMAGPVSMAFEAHDHLHVFCMYAMSTIGFECIKGKIDYGPDDAVELTKQLSIDERCFKFGEHAVIVPAVKFIERAEAALTRAKINARLGAVEYFDGATFHGSASEMTIPFRKLKEFSFQNEFRICLDTQTRGVNPYTLSLGDLRDCSVLVRSAELNKLFRIDSITETVKP